MRIHVNLATEAHINKFDRTMHVVMLAGKMEDLAYTNNPDFLSSGVKRCRWVRYNMEGLQAKNNLIEGGMK